MAELGHETDQAKAAFLGLQQSTLLRVRRGDVEPSQKFLGRIQDRFPGMTFEQLVERVDASHPSGPAGPRPSGPAGPRPKDAEAGAA